MKWVCHHPHCTCEEGETEELRILPKIKQVKLGFEPYSLVPESVLLTPKLVCGRHGLLFLYYSSRTNRIV